MSVEAFYESITSTFNAAATLVPSPFSQLFTGEAPENTDLPYCVLLPAEESKISRTFGSKYFADTFSFHVFGRTLELVGGYVRAIDAVFDVRTLTLSPTGVDVITVDKTGEMNRQVAISQWESVLQYVAQYRIVR